MVDREVEMSGFVEVFVKWRREESEQMLRSFISARQRQTKTRRQDNLVFASRDSSYSLYKRQHLATAKL